MNVKQIAMIRQPRDLVWITMRDSLPELAETLDDIESVVTVSRNVDSSGVTIVESKWRACPDLPPLIAEHVNREMLAWTDHAKWDSKEYLSEWILKPHALADQLRCYGSTKYFEAMGGAGTRVVFEVNAEFMPGSANAQVDGAGPFLKAVKSTVVSIVCSNLRRLLETVDEIIQSES